MLSVVRCQHIDTDEYAGIRNRLILDTRHIVDYKTKYADFLASMIDHFG